MEYKQHAEQKKTEKEEENKRSSGIQNEKNQTKKTEQKINRKNKNKDETISDDGSNVTEKTNTGEQLDKKSQADNIQNQIKEGKDQDKKSKFENNQQNTETQPPKEVPQRMSVFKIFVIFLVAYMSYGQIKPYFAEKNPELDHFVNDLKPGQTFDLVFILRDLKKRTDIPVFKQRQIVYQSQPAVLNFTLEIDRKKLEKNPERYRLETQILYNSKNLGHVKAVGCLSTITKKMQIKMKSGEYYNSVEKDNFGATEFHVFTRLYTHLIFDSNTYDFSEDEIVNYFYQLGPRRRTLPVNVTDNYFPATDCFNYWTLRRDKIPLSMFKDNTTIPIQVEFDMPSITKHMWAFKFYVAENTDMPYLNAVKMLEEFKTILSDNGFYYLVILFSVNFLHSLFSILSMKNSLSFFRSLKSTQGISMRKHYTDILFQAIIILYLIENDTSIVVIVMTGLEILMSVYIVCKMTKLEKTIDNRFPYYQFQKSKEEAECETDKYDREATTFLSKVFFPLLGVYYVYSFWTSQNISYYSFALKNLVAFIHAVGFINMTPQVYINYKLKSVEFMPWKAMVYQFLNTIVDDLFAFAVQMPTLQRISVFRDDLIFVIYMYQKWIYRKNIREEKKED